MWMLAYTLVYSDINTLLKLLSLHNLLHLSLAISLFLLLIFPEKWKQREIEMKLNQAYESISLPSPSKPATQVHTKPCPAYENVIQARH